MKLTYLLQVDGPDPLVKVGRTKNVKARIASLKTGLPWPCRLVALVGSDVEQELHSMFAADRVNGEWIRPSQQMADWLERARSDGRLVKQVAVDRRYINAVIKPRILEYLKGREPENNQAGDLVRVVLNDLLPSMDGRESALSAATKGHVTEALCRGYGPTTDPATLFVPNVDSSRTRTDGVAA